ncbi:MAG: hypothetical protein KC912_15380 [Proteobacteria bacterium]|nr:hypothetical protein [Pseudomonadota bacterium]
MPAALVTGFGPFLEVIDNPSAALVRQLDGLRAGPWTLHGRVLDVSYARGPEQAVREAARLEAAWVVGFGVSRRGGLRVERTGQAHVGDSADVDGQCPAVLHGPSSVRATLDATALAGALGCGISDDAGAYVCNAWLHQVTQRVGVPAVFVHIPPEGVDAERVRAALALLPLSLG